MSVNHSFVRRSVRALRFSTLIAPAALAACAVSASDVEREGTGSTTQAATRGGVDLSSDTTTDTRDTSTTKSRDNGLQKSAAIDGKISVTYASPKGGVSRPLAQYAVVDAKGISHPLVISEDQIAAAGGVRAILGHKIHISGVLVADGLKVSGFLDTEPSIPQVNFTGTKRYATIMCRFPNMPLPATEDVPHFLNLFGNTAPGLADYWSQASYGALNLDMADMLSWADLPKDLPQYVTPDGSLDTANLFTDCAKTASGALFLPDYDGVNLVYSHNLPTANLGGFITLFVDGQDKTYGFTALSPTGFRSHALAAQAMGSSFGLRLTGSAPGKLDSNWDVMSAGGVCTGALDPFLGCIAVQPAAYHKDSLNWIPANKRAVISTYQTLTLDRADAPATNSTIALVPYATNKFYSVEVRGPSTPTSYDARVPQSGVVIHRWDLTPFSGGTPVEEQLSAWRGFVVDADGNNNPNDDGAVFQQGERFFDETNRVAVTVHEGTATGYRMTVARSVPLTLIQPSASTGGSLSAPGLSCGTTCAASFAVGTLVTISAEPPLGYRVKRWGGSCADQLGPTTCTLSMFGPATVSVTFERDPNCYSDCFDMCMRDPEPPVQVPGQGTMPGNHGPRPSDCVQSCQHLCGL
jgi:hypothetical protein